MRRTALVLLPVLAMIFPKMALANVSVNVSGNGPGATSNVSVNNSQSGSMLSQSSSNTTTNIRIENNGEVKEFRSEDDGNFHVESSDGTSKVDVTNQSNSASVIKNNTDTVNTDIRVNVNSSGSSEASASSAPLETPDIIEIEKKQFDLMEFLRHEIENIFKSIFH